jgi:hypothetical protein
MTSGDGNTSMVTTWTHCSDYSTWDGISATIDRFQTIAQFWGFSIPDSGGWLMLTGGVLIRFGICFEAGLLNRFFKKGIKSYVLDPYRLMFYSM